jgi:hypothetical protein
MILHKKKKMHCLVSGLREIGYKVFLFYDGLDKRRENESERNRLTVRSGTTNLELKLRL